MTIAQLAPLPLQHLRRGKVREVYVVDDDRLLLVATDRVSAFDVVMAEADSVQGRGAHADHRVVAAAARARRHDITCCRRTPTRSSTLVPVARRSSRRRSPAARCSVGERRCSRSSASFADISPARRGRSIARVGNARRRIVGARNLRESERLDPPLFSPATKAESGHDENITDRARRRGRSDRTSPRELERLSRLVYERGRAIAAERGIIIADTKFEFGRDRAGTITLIDEVLTPDSSRFWPAEQYQPGRSQPSFDKQPLRDYLDAERRAGRWNGDAPPPAAAGRGRPSDERALPRCLPSNHRT